MARYLASMALAAAIAAVAAVHWKWQSAEQSDGRVGGSSLTLHPLAVSAAAVLGVLPGSAHSHEARMARMRRATRQRHWKVIRKLRIASRRARRLAAAAARARVVRLGAGARPAPVTGLRNHAAARPWTGPGP